MKRRLTEAALSFCPTAVRRSGTHRVQTRGQVARVRIHATSAHPQSPKIQLDVARRPSGKLGEIPLARGLLF